MNVDRARVLAYRVQRQGLHRDGAEPAVLDLGVQDSGGRSPWVALAARTITAPDPTPLTTVWTLRGAPHLIRRVDLPFFAAAAWPRTDADAWARLGGFGTALRKAGIGGIEAVRRGAEAMRAATPTGRPRGEVSAAMTAALPADYSYPCPTCRSTHVYGSLFQLAGGFAGVEVRSGRPTTLAPLPERGPIPTEPRGTDALLTRYLSLNGPATLAHAAALLDTSQAQVRPVWPDGLAEVTVDGQARWLPEEDLPALREAPDPDLVRLLPAHDPLLGRDRDLLVPDPARQKVLWRAVSNPGAVLSGVDVVGTWRGRADKDRLRVEVTGFAPLPAAVRRAVRDEADVVAAARGAADVTVVF